MASSTIKDIAKMTGVSIATVSRVINGNYPVSAEAKEKVLKAIDQLDYKPNAVARSLKMEASNTIGILISDIANPFFTHIAKAVEKVVSKDKYNIIICSTEEDAKNEVDYLRMLVEKRVDGIILSSSCENDILVREIKKLGIPVVLIDRSIEGIELDFVADDSFHGAYTLVKYLIDLGHRDIAIIDGPHSISTGSDRLKGYLTAHEQAGFKPRKELMYNGSYSQEYGYETACRLFKEMRPATAIFAANNLIAKGVIIAANEMQKSFPEDVSLVCFGDSEFVKLITPPVTCIVQKPVDIGTKAGELILKRISQKAGSREKIIFQPELFIGRSCRKV